MKVLVACEVSGTVRDEFLRRGHDAWSCDIEPAESMPERHYQGDARDVLDMGWDLMIAHPPCERLCVSGARWLYEKEGWGDEQERSLLLVRAFLDAPIPRICLENPVGIISTRIREPDQIIQPWMFGHGEIKATCLWLKNLPWLKSTNVVAGREARVHKLPPSPMRKMLRQFRYKGVADAMADQWGALPIDAFVDQDDQYRLFG
jgi:hypothetical protein